MDWPFRTMALWTGRHVFHLGGIAATADPTGSGDSALGWIGALVLLLTSLVAGFVWSAVSESGFNRQREAERAAGRILPTKWRQPAQAVLYFLFSPK